MTLSRLLAGVFLAWLLAASASARADRLAIDFMISSGAQRAAWMKLLADFRAQYPGIDVVHNEFEQETYKRDFEKRLRSGDVDIAFWFAGERLRQAIAANLVAPLDLAVAGDMKDSFVRSTLEAVQSDGRTHAVPLKYYPWGFFYMRSVFAREGIAPPKTWAEFLDACEKLKAAGIVPTATGAKDGWPMAAWFDYLNLRINGIEFHQQLLRGEKRFSDPRARKVFEEWRGLLSKGYFLDETFDSSWDSVLPYLYRGRVGMVLMGGFAVPKFSPMVQNDIGFFAFPRIARDVGRAEEAPLDVMVQAARGRHPQAARQFMAFLARHPGLDDFNHQIGTLSPRLKAQTADPLLQQGKAMLTDASGITFFFDRDARQHLVKPAFDAFRTFVRPPYDVDAAIARIERARP